MNAWRTIRSDYLAAKRNDPSISDGARVVKLGGSPVRQQTAAEAYAAELEARIARLEEEIRELRAARAETPPYLSVQRFSAASRRRGTPRAGA